MRISVGPDEAFFGVAWSPDGKAIADIRYSPSNDVAVLEIRSRKTAIAGPSHR